MVNDTNSALLNSDRLTATGIPSSQFEDPNLLGISPRASSLISPVTSRLAALSTPADVDIEAIGANWVAQGPAPINTTISSGGTVTINPNNQVAGAIRTVIVNPNDPNTLWVGTVNGGIWRTNTANQATPAWTPLTDEFRGLSIGAMDLDPTNLDSQRNPRTIVAGTGHFSSYGLLGGPLTGLLLSTDGGNNFREVRDSSGNALLQNTNISGVVIRGNTIFAATDSGVFRLVSNDNGTTWNSTLVLVGRAFDLVADSTNNFYVSIQGVGIFINPGVNGAWNNVSAPINGANNVANGRQAIDAAIAAVGTNTNINTKMTIAANGRIYVGVVRGTDNNDNSPVYFGFSDDQGQTWTQMDFQQMNLPISLRSGYPGVRYFSIVADSNNSNIVYLGADFLGGTLLRGTTSRPGNTTTTVWQTLSGAGGAASNSSPHVDSRKMVFDGSDLIEVDDGGIYRRTNPQNNTGGWFSLNGNLQITEQHDIAYDTVSNILISGNQDNGTTQQTTTPGTWDLFQGGDGGDVAVGINPNNSAQSVRYSSIQNLGGFTRRFYGNTNNLISTTPIVFDTNGDGKADSLTNLPDVTPIAINAFDADRLVIGGGRNIYEFTDPYTLAPPGSPALTVNTTVTPIPGVGEVNFGYGIAYGGRRSGQGEANVLYIGSNESIPNPSGPPTINHDLYIRGDTGTTLGQTAYRNISNAGSVRGIALDNKDWQTAFVIDNDNVFQTTNAGANWIDITGDLFDPVRFSKLDLNRFANPLGTEDYLVSIEFVSSLTLGDALVVGTTQGVFASLSNNWSDWFAVGPATQPNAAQTRLPHVPVWDMDFVNATPNAPNGLLAVGTLGRGAWTINNINTVLNSAPRPNGGSSYDVNEGSSVMLDASGSSDPNSLALTYTWDLDGDGIFGETGLNAIRGAEVGINPTFSAAELDGPRDSTTVKLRVINSEGSSAVDKNIRINVKNVAPKINGITLSSTVINENDTITLTGSFIDPGIPDTHTVTINWGDGTTSNIPVDQDRLNRSFQLSHQYLDDSPSGTPSDLLPITVTVTDSDGGSDQASTAIRVNNIAPVITSFTSNANFTDRARINKPVNINATFTDIGTLDTHRAFVDWGDGTPTQEVNILQSRGYGTVQGSHIYAKGGAFKMKLTLLDDDTGEDDAFTRAIIIGNGGGPG